MKKEVDECLLPFLLERILDEMPAWLYNSNMIRFLIPTAKEMKPLDEVPYQKISEKSVAILKEITLNLSRLAKKSSAGIEFCLEKQGAILQ